MLLRSNDRVPTQMLPGLVHRTLAGAEDGMRRVAVWEEVLAPGGATPLHRHAGEEVVVVLEGRGTLEIGGDPIAFGPRSTIIVPHDVTHRIVNDGEGELRLIAALSTPHVVVTTPAGDPIPLPWS
jgi:quercetin dioxygenase-like cupin family protein